MLRPLRTLAALQGSMTAGVFTLPLLFVVPSFESQFSQWLVTSGATVDMVRTE